MGTGTAEKTGSSGEAAQSSRGRARSGGGGEFGQNGDSAELGAAGALRLVEVKRRLQVEPALRIGPERPRDADGGFGGNAAAAVADAADDGRVYPGSGGEAPAGNAELLKRLPEQVSGMRNFKFGLSCGHGGENFQFQW